MITRLCLIMAMALVLGCAPETSYRTEGLPSAESYPQVGPVMQEAGKAAVQTALSDGPGIAALLNKNYNENTTSCTEYGTGKAKGYYFCTGVLLRGTDDGNFNPWESSADALRLQGTSFSWIRWDFSTYELFKAAGFVILSPADAIDETVPGVVWTKELVKCVYPFDAWTRRTMNRRFHGCDFEGTGLSFSDTAWGSCDNVLGITSSAQWDAHFRSQGQNLYKQCSWNADKPQNWRNAIASHNQFPAQSHWNEVMVHNWGSNAEHSRLAAELMRKSIVAFFYDPQKGGGLTIAQAFQRKLAATGPRAPIVRLDFNAENTSRFQFRQADQVSYP